jgi:hypothetical protein
MSAKKKIRKRDEPTIQLRLYVAGQTTKSLGAFVNLKRICETHLAGQYRIEVIDLLRIRSSRPVIRFSPCRRWCGDCRNRSKNHRRSFQRGTGARRTRCGARKGIVSCDLVKHAPKDFDQPDERRHHGGRAPSAVRGALPSSALHRGHYAAV